MIKTDTNSVDVVIIGAGIGGLVCGCYLAKSGMKVLIAEHHFKPGGYCTSFKRKDFIFDAAAHSFGSCREGGIMNKVIKDMNLDKSLKITRHDPSDTIISPDYKISFWSDINRTVQEFQKAFHHQSDGIKKFFLFLLNSNPSDLISLRNKTFQDLLNQYFSDEKLKSILSFPVLGNGGLPPSQISAFTAVKIYTEFLLDGGYYPEDSMQSLSDALAEKFKTFGGELLLSCKVKKITVKDGMVVGVVLDKNNRLSSRCVVSNCDARQTYFDLLGPRVVNKEYLHKLASIIPSHSVYVAYLGIDQYYEDLPKPGVNVWIMPHYDIEKMYHLLTNKGIHESTGFMMRMSPNKKSLQAFVNAPFKNKKYWSENKYAFLDDFIRQIEKLIPGVSKHIVFKDAGTPYTMYRYTLNYKGAAYGWASIPSQFTDPYLKTGSSIRGLYTAGHWSSQAQGIPGVAYMGLDAAKSILKKNYHGAKNGM